MNARQPTFLWHDYETFGTDPAVDRPVQFAALRTDADLQEIGEPMVWWCAPAADTLPHPGACLVTGITPGQAAQKGMSEPDFARRIHGAMMQPDTCSVGYNSLRFDDEFTRHLLYRNFYDPYEREWRNGNSRWDLIDLARMCYALRPEGIKWPEREPGVPSFKLEDLTAANGIEHAGAHEALADVRATLAFARLLRSSQPRLFEWSLALRDKRKVLELFDLKDPQPLLHSSSRYPAARGATTLVLPLAEHAEQRNVFIVVDLAADPAPLLNADPTDIA
ncbi:MAG: exodeoxyribonuclease I, partial [Xanthomonadales bacterium]|nr:exodeoxyribonuclease I [Xanthomonadales bacterium]